MPTIEERALALVNAATDSNLDSIEDFSRGGILKALFNSLEGHDATLAEFEAFRREVSDAVEDYYGEYRKDSMHPLLSRFIIPNPVDPLVEAIREASVSDADSGDAERLRAALAKRGLKLVEVGK